jgi:chemotaxis signal transduction protein
MADEPVEAPSFLVFESGGREYAIEVETTEGVVDCPRFCPLPGAPEGIVGVASIRGRMTIVADLSREEEPHAAKRRLVLIKGDSRLGLFADRVRGVVASTHAITRSKPSGEVGWPIKGSFIIDGKRVPVLDVEGFVELCVGPG